MLICEIPATIQPCLLSLPPSLLSCSYRTLHTSDPYKILLASDLAIMLPYKNLLLVTTISYTHLLLATADSYMIFVCQ